MKKTLIDKLRAGFCALTLVGLVATSVGIGIKNKPVSYIGAGAFVAGACVYILTSKAEDNYKKKVKY